MKILAIETSCDETAAAVVEDGIKILSNVVASSSAMHQKYGGVVPEVAARQQIKCIIPTIEEALKPFYSSSEVISPSRETNNKSSSLASNDIISIIHKYIDSLAVTVGPGLIGSLLVGVETAKTIAFVTGKPVIPVNHVLAHMYANFVDSEVSSSSEASSPSREANDVSSQLSLSRAESRDSNNNILCPAISLVVSGGHTELYLMTSHKNLKWLGGTLDDAAGEAFDKTARLLGFENKGGPAIAAAAAKFSIQHSAFSIQLPRPLIHDDSLNFSFSGLKTAVLREWKKYNPTVIPAKAGIYIDRTTMRSAMTKESLVNVFAHEVQEAITDVLVAKTIKAARIYDAKSILLSGGVAANTRLREKFSIWHSSFDIHVPEAELCTDNAVYIASYAYFRGQQTHWRHVTAAPDVSVEIT